MGNNKVIAVEQRGDATSNTPSPDSMVPKAPKARWAALDSFRFVAVCLMVQGHVFSTLLDRATKSQSWYPHHSFVHGYTAPMFLFGAGLAFGYTTFRRWDDQLKWGPASKKRFKRYAWLFVIGYGLHVPFLSLSRLLHLEDPVRIAGFLQVDVLQHIAMSLVIAQVLVMVLRKRQLFVSAVAAIAVFVIFAAPWVWQWDTSGLPIALRGYVNPTPPVPDSRGSLFPLVPWAGFTYMGILAAYAVGVRGSATEVSRRVAWPLLTMAAFCMIAPVVVDRFGFWPWPEHNFWHANPLFFFFRLGNVMLVLAALCFVERLGTSWPRGRTDPPTVGRSHPVVGWFSRRVVPWVRTIGEESLIVYVAHLLVLHGSVLGPGIKHSSIIRAHSHGLWDATWVAALLLLAMALLARFWSTLKTKPFAFKAVKYLLIFLVVYLMVASS